MSRHMDLEIVKPSPVPPNWRAVPASACWKASKIAPSRSGGIPIPLSWISTAAGVLVPSSTVARTTISPVSVNLRAFPSRFTITCFSLAESATKSSTTSGTSTRTSTFPCFCLICPSTNATASLTRARRDTV